MGKEDILDVGSGNPYSMLDAHRNGKSRSENQESRDKDVPFSSNCVRLSGREWVIVGIAFSALLCFGPSLWERIGRFEPEADYRLPYELSSDYWLYSRYCRWACRHYETLIIGDSVIWGHYVSEDNTLSHYLNKIAGRNQFANLGVDGIHPAALAGLLKYYGRDISDKNVVLHLNPLWMSSSKHDLRISKEFHFNHPRLVPQFVPRIPCYKDSFSKRISAVVERYVALLSWSSHLKIAYFKSLDMPTWTLEHPYDVPRFEIQDSNFEVPRPEGAAGVARQDFQWVELTTSLQWKLFRQSVEILKARGNRIFVLVGPFNEHIMNGRSAEAYLNMKSEIEAWLRKNNIAYYIPEALPSEFYCDASHPVGEGYAVLAKRLYQVIHFDYERTKAGKSVRQVTGGHSSVKSLP